VTGRPPGAAGTRFWGDMRGTLLRKASALLRGSVRTSGHRNVRRTCVRTRTYGGWRRPGSKRPTLACKAKPKAPPIAHDPQQFPAFYALRPRLQAQLYACEAVRGNAVFTGVW